MTRPAPLRRHLRTSDAVVIGLASMIGAGVFSAFAPAAAAAGSGLLIGLGVAAVVAYGNATSSAELAARYPTSGGAYVYGRARLGPWWGFVAGWGFVIGKTASCAAMALTFAAYVAPGGGWGQRSVAILGVAALTGINLLGVSRTARVARWLVAGTLLALGVVVGAILASGRVDGGNLAIGDAPGGPYGVLQAAGLLFFAFAGYARIATLGEEVLEPARTIPRAIPLALGITVAVYLAVGATVLGALGAQRLADAAAPLAAAVTAAGAVWAEPVVRAGATVASLGALLALIAGVGRTALAMAREGDLPRAFAAVDQRRSVPHRAEMAIAAAVIVLVAVVDLRGAIGFSSFGVLTYYAIANAAALTLGPDERRSPRFVSVIGLIGCATLVVTLPIDAVVAGIGMFAVGLGGRAWRMRRET